jgi:hypothetical protein
MVLIDPHKRLYGYLDQAALMQSKLGDSAIQAFNNVLRNARFAAVKSEAGIKFVRTFEGHFPFMKTPVGLRQVPYKLKTFAAGVRGSRVFGHVERFGDISVVVFDTYCKAKKAHRPLGISGRADLEAAP